MKNLTNLSFSSCNPSFKYKVFKCLEWLFNSLVVKLLIKSSLLEVMPHSIFSFFFLRTFQSVFKVFQKSLCAVTLVRNPNPRFS